MKRIIFTLLVISAFIGGFYLMNAAKSSPPGNQAKDALKILNWNLGSEPATLDPQLNKDLYGGSIINNIFEGLFRTRGSKIEPAIAESYEVSEDGLTYTFKLKETRWSDGSPLTAHDFEYAWKRALNPEVASEYAYQLYYIKGGEAFNQGKGAKDNVMVNAMDDFTLQVVLNAPTPYFLDLLTFFTYLPTKQSLVEAYPDGSWAIDPMKSVSNGPFILTVFTRGDRLVLSKNRHYWNADHIKLDQINIAMIVDASTTLTAYESGELDIIDSVPLAEIPKLIAENPEFKVLPSIATSYYLLKTDSAPLDNVLVRKALSLSIDRKALVESVTKAGELAASGFTPPGLYDERGNDFHTMAGDYDIMTSCADIDTAKSLLAKAGYPDGKNFPVLEILYNTSETNLMLAAAIQEMWKKNLNIEVKLVDQEFTVFQESKLQGNFMIARGSWFGDYADPMAMLELWTSSNAINTTGWKNRTYDTLIESAKVTTGQERFDHLYEAQKILMNDSPVIPLYYFTDIFMISNHIIGWEKTPMGVWYFGNTAIVETEK